MDGERGAFAKIPRFMLNTVACFSCFNGSVAQCCLNPL